MLFNLDKLHKIIRVVLIAIPIFAFLWLLDKNFVLSGTLETVYGFDKNNPIISVLKPAGRVLQIEQNKQGDYWQPIIIDPVYFDLHLPTKFKQATLIFVYQTPKDQIVKVGPQIFSDDWSYYLQELRCESKEREWCISEVYFDLTKAYLNNRKIKFMISAPGLDKTGQQIKISQINLILSKH